MSDFTQYNDEITDYLYNDMSEQEKAAFEAKLLINSELAEEVERQKAILEAIATRLTYQQAMADPNINEIQRIANIAVPLINAPSAPETVKYTPKQRIFHYLLAASQLAATIVLAIMLSKSPSTETLFTNFYRPYSFNLNFLNPGSQSGTLLAQSFRYYNSGNYNQVIASLTGLRMNGGLTPEASFSLGLAYMALDDYNNAREVFLEHKESYSDYQPEVNWYLSLIYIKQDNPAKAKEMLNAIIAANTTLSNKAIKLSRKLDRMMN